MEQQLNSQIDDTVPLVFDSEGWEHLGCGGPGRKSSHYGIAECLTCGRTVPNRELGKLIEDRYNPIDGPMRR